VLTRISLIASLLAGALANAWGASSIAPEHPFSWGQNIGWLNWRGDGASGVQVTASYCAGFVYAANTGWMNLGNKPADGLHYSNTGGDLGVNLDLSGNLRGYGYAGNIGWINFEERGAPRVDFTSGKFSGYAYSANAGWISLGDQTTFVQTVPSPGTVDLDQDTIADAWELQYAGNLTRLGLRSDADHDGVSDVDEFLAGTNPLNPGDLLKIIQIAKDPTGTSLKLIWLSKADRQYTIESSTNLQPGNWKEVRTVPGDPESSFTSITLPTSGSPEFFRIRATPPAA
jgi:hypothetical protein